MYTYNVHYLFALTIARLQHAAARACKHVPQFNVDATEVTTLMHFEVLKRLRPLTLTRTCMLVHRLAVSMITAV
jgi:hypothetical protein